MPERKPPSLLEIFGLPLAGALFIDAIYTRDNEPVLFLVPFVVAIIRLFIAQFQVPPQDENSDDRAVRARRTCIAINQLAVFVLIFVEAGAVMISNPTVPSIFQVVVSAIFALYIGLRLCSRRYWMIAAGQQ